MNIEAFLSVLTFVSEEAKLIDDLNNCFNFDHNVVLGNRLTDISNYVRNEDQPRSLFKFVNSNGRFVGLESLQVIKTKNAFMIVAPESSNFQMNINLLKQIKNAKSYDRNMKIGIFFQTETSMDDVRSHFQWFRDHLVSNIFAAMYHPISGSLNVFTFHSFGIFEMMNVTSRNTCEEIFPNLDFNYHKH